MSEVKELSMREQAIKALNEGNAVIINGQQYTLRGNPDLNIKSIADLPSEAEFAMGDTLAEADALAKIQKDIAELRRLESMLTANKVAKEESAPVESKKAPTKADKVESKEEGK